jgi:NitT/TauT family transport system substrate-binding protein
MEAEFMRNLNLLLVVLLVFFAIMIGGCTGEKEPDPTVNEEVTELTVGEAPGPVSYPLAHMTQTDSNLVTMPWKTYDQLLAMITAKQVKLSSSPITNAVMAYKKGVNIKLVNVAVWGMLYVVSSDQSLQGLDNLKGKEVAVNGQGSIHDLVFRHLLIQKGIDPDTDLTISYMDLPEASARLVSGDIEYAVLNEPSSSIAILNAKKAGIDLYRAVDLSEEWGKIPGQEGNRIPQAGFIMIEDSGITADEVISFANKYEESAKWINDNPSEAGTLVEKQNEQMKAPAVSDSLKYARLQPKMAIDCREEVEAFLSELIKTAPPNALGGKLPDAEFYFQK